MSRARPLRLAAQDVGLSVRKRSFESGRGYCKLEIPARSARLRISRPEAGTTLAGGFSHQIESEIQNKKAGGRHNHFSLTQGQIMNVQTQLCVGLRPFAFVLHIALMADAMG